MGNIHPCLWFADEAEQAVRFYVSVFPNSRITGVLPFNDAGPGKPGEPMLISFVLDGEDFLALNGGSTIPHTEAVSFVKSCRTQQEVDEQWARLTDGGQEGQCGWLKDRYGVSWQIVPAEAMDMLRDPDPAKAAAVTTAMLTMRKIQIEPLRVAYETA
jgi:predicted 3-demethylubiquinone-9 3-methyltransferase (glyoxalase superfamily)